MEIFYTFASAVVVAVIVTKFLNRGIRTLSTADLKSLMEKKDPDYFYMDVRTPGEFKKNKIKGFRNIPLNDLSKRLNQIPQDKKIVVICQSGARSSAACRQLSKAGYKELINIRGGMNFWK